MLVSLRNDSMQPQMVEVLFESSDPAVVAPEPLTVYVPGKRASNLKPAPSRFLFVVTGLSPGTATITARVGGLTSAPSTVTVK